jgi:hypothetical protein
MDLSKIIAVAGKPGLYKVVGQSGKGFIVESLLDGKRMPTYATQQVSSLSEISIYGQESDKLLSEIFEAIFKLENGGKPSVGVQSNRDEIRGYFEKVFSDYASERVYDSDIRKVLKWYELLLDKDLLKPEENLEETPAAEAEESATEKPKAKAVAKAAKATPKSGPKPAVNSPKGGGKSSAAKGGVKASVPRKAS